MSDRPGPLAERLAHYRQTRAQHRPVPFLVPLAVVSVLALLAFLLLDQRAGALHGAWPAWLAAPALVVTDLGKSGWILIASACVSVLATLAGLALASGLWQRRMAILVQISGYIFLSVGAASLFSNIVKRLIGRPRPAFMEELGLFSFHPLAHSYNLESFPSGHSTTSGALWMALALLFPRWRWPLLAVGFYLALTRVFVGAHYPSDILTGYAIGVWFALLMALMFSRFGILFDQSAGGLTVRRISAAA